MTENNQQQQQQQQQQLHDAMQMAERFVALANEIKDEGKPVELVNAAMQLASGIYSTYIAAGNEGYLKEPGIRKVVNAYEHNLTRIQAYKKAQYNPEDKD